MPRARIYLNESSWRNFGRALNSHRFNNAIRSGIKIGLKKAARYLIREMKKAINRRSYTANRALTIALKLSAKPLVGSRTSTTNLVDSMGYLMNGNYEIHVGSVRGSSFNGRRYNIAEIVHDGCIIRITPKMGLWLATATNRVQNRFGMSVDDIASSVVGYERRRYRRNVTLSSKTAGRGFIVIPRRPWLVNIFSSVIHQRVVADIIDTAVIDRIRMYARRTP